MNSTLQIGKFMGIPVRLHWTFLALIVYIGVGFGYLSQPIFGIPYGFGTIEPVRVKLLYSFSFAILLLACVALHELGHSYVARVYGIGIRSITLYFFGGVSSMEDIPRNPKIEFEMAFAGPGVSGIIGLVCILVYFQLSALLSANHPFTVLFSNLGVVNLILMVFNLLPAFPMDGGRVLRSWLATRMPYMTATSKAVSIGKMFAILMGIFGLFSGGILLLVIAFFIYIGASEEERANSINICLEGIKVKNIMSADVHTVPPRMNLRELTDLVFREKHRGYPVAENDKLLGMVTTADIQRIPEHLRESTTVGDVMSRKIFDIGPNEEAAVAMKKLTELGVRGLPVIENGRLLGILSREDLVWAMEFCSGRITDFDKKGK
ncbi:MAG: site-2 protease family protein [Methanotrichaceae archaeon]|jgi:Zn-dependent protease/CBS domain-containing protein